MDTKRRKLFNSLASLHVEKKTYPIRPPYATSEALFVKQCFTCKDAPCINSCEEEIIAIKENTPTLTFKYSGCTYCGECVDACEKEVLSKQGSKKINADFSIDLEKCLAWNGVICYTCKDACDERAIEFFGTFRPQIKSQKCTSCGFCVSPCPSQAIKVLSREIVCDFS